MALRIEGLRKGYRVGLRRRVEVLRGLSLCVGQGEVYGLLGRNGAGKSTTFRILMGLCRPEAGSIRLLGERPGARSAQLRVGYCPENPQFPLGLTVLEVLRFHRALVGERVHSPRTRIDWLLEEFDLEEYRRRPVRALSRGTIQRLALALALLARPELLILDEPLTALDPVARHRVNEILLDQKRQGASMIVASHILSELESISDRLGVLSGGVIQREIDLRVEAAEAVRALEIRVPSEREAEIRAGSPDLVGVAEGRTVCYRELAFDQAQELVRRWSAAGIPVLAMGPSRRAMEAEILAIIDHPAAPPAARPPEAATAGQRPEPRPAPEKETV
ncbi:MAG: ABC transporter ATP-binding protein [Candidatus Krumholzibacteriota bacterium]|nr:ABC transporter ATP-binding protein [Candidatus Krumholzibacteriota bacterium]